MASALTAAKLLSRAEAGRRLRSDLGRLTLVVFHKVMDLAEHRAGSAHLPHQPFEHAIMSGSRLRSEVTRPTSNKREVEHGAGPLLKHQRRDAGSMLG